MDDFEKFYNKSSTFSGFGDPPNSNEEFKKVLDKALRFLSFRPRSEKEIKDFLKRKKVSASVIGIILTKLKNQKFVNDEEFAKWWMEQRTSFRPLGLRLIKIELRQKGLSQEIIEKIISNDEFLISNDLEQVRKLIEKKIARYKGLSRQELYQKLGGFLARRGFDWETIKQAIDEVVKKGV